MRHVLALTIVLATVAAAGTPSTRTSDAQTPAAITIRAARVFDGRGKVLENAVVEIRGSKITVVGPARAGAVTHDLGDVTLMPGLIDVHTHIDWHFGPDGKYPARNETPEQRDAAIAKNLEATLLAGVTTVQNVGNRADAALREATASGTLPGPRILTSLGSIQGSATATPDQLRERVRQFKKEGADLVKIFASESSRTGGAPTMTQEQLDAACGEANDQKLRTLVHAHAAEAVMRAARAGCTQVEHGAFADAEALALLKARGTFFDPNIGLVTQNYLENRERFYTPTGGYNDEGFAAMEKAMPEKIKAFKQALASGVQMPMGTDAVAGAHGQNAREIIARVKDGGQPPIDALVGATSLAARSMRLENMIGALAAGYEADIIAVAGNPLTDITAVRDVVFVMRGGKIYKKP